MSSCSAGVGAQPAGAPLAPYDKARLPRDLRLYAVTDSRWLNGGRLEDAVARVIAGGATFVQLREKTGTHEQRVEVARRVLAVCRRMGVPFVVNDDVACALEVGADGVHVGQGDMACARARELLGPQAIVGVSAHTPAEARAAELAGADYLGVGAVFSTGTKADANDVGLAGLRAVCAATPLPVVAIGGIDAGNAGELAGTGACGAAVVSALFASADPVAAARELRATVDAWAPGV